MAAGRECTARADAALGEIIETTRRLSSQSQTVARTSDEIDEAGERSVGCAAIT